MYWIWILVSVDIIVCILDMFFKNVKKRDNFLVTAKTTSVELNIQHHVVVVNDHPKKKKEKEKLMAS